MGQRLVDIGNRRVGEQIVGFVVAGGIAPGKAGNRGGVVCAEAASGLEGEGGRGRAVGGGPAEGDGRVAIDLVAELAIECRQFVAELGQGVQGLDHRAFEVFIDFGGGVVVAVDVAAVVGSAQQFHVVAAGERAHVVDLWRPGIRRGCWRGWC